MNPEKIEELCRNLFESTYQVLLDYHLIPAEYNNEMKKQQAAKACLQILKEKLEDKEWHTDTELLDLMTELTSLMGVHFPEDMRMQDAFKRIIGEIRHLQIRVSSLESSNQSLATEVRSLESSNHSLATEVRSLVSAARLKVVAAPARGERGLSPPRFGLSPPRFNRKP